ncbi:hypothetical protein A7C99_1145 [Trichophyton rubrum]|uniref:AMP-dependent synthetase/ligase domain-containing protein n=1 Tax=Trichophyton rubrum TaxID=5551 RepID=A0A178F5Q9_TRIRU|nr:hypothetical protein HL42_1932 [Trichophyton rubrum]OAL67285.1 hypothetical protein A7C99_1145 [Trichophyton rubrum]
MAAEDSMLARADALLEALFSDWNIYSTLLATVLVSYIGYTLFFTPDPDAHPYVLARQGMVAPVRQRGESASVRAMDVPHGYPLKAGLGVRDPDTPRWTAGRRGDLRDIWKAVVRGELNSDGTPSGKKGSIFTVFGNTAQERSVDDISREIKIIGQYIRDTKAQRVAICLTDSVEMLATIFASAFYGFPIVIIPHNLPPQTLAGYLQETKVDVLIAEAGAVEVTTLLKMCPALRHGIWVAQEGSRHMDWNEVPEGAGSKIEVSTWHELVNEKEGSVGPEVPEWDVKSPTPSLTTLCPSKKGLGSFVEYTSENIISGVAALGSSLPRNEQLKSSDLVLSIDSLAHSYTLCFVLAALYSNASIAFNSVAGEIVDFALATTGVSPTIIIASSHTMSDYHAQYMGPQLNPLVKLGRFFQTRALESGRMPSSNILSALGGSGPVSEQALKNLRLILVSHRAEGDRNNQLTSDQLTDFRIMTGVRLAYALTTGKVAGAVCQTNPYDYRGQRGFSHFGPPLNSVEVKLVDYDEKSGNEKAIEGKIHISGPAVVSGECKLEADGLFQEDSTLVLLA